MRIAVDYCEPAYTPEGVPDGYPGPSGFIPAYMFGGYAQDDDHANKIRVGDYVHCKGNFKKPPTPPAVENFTFKISQKTGRKISFRDTLADGTEVWRTVMARAQDSSPAGNPYNGGQQARPAIQAAPAPRSAGNAPQNAPTTPARVIPTLSQAAAVLRECLDAVMPWGTPEHATTLFLGRLRGDIKRDPTPQEIEAEAKRKADAAKAAAEAAAKAAQEAAERMAGYEQGQPDSGDDDLIPF